MEFSILFSLCIFALAVAVTLWWRKRIFTIIIHDYEKGLRYRDGHLLETLSTGRYFYNRSRSSIERVDLRKTSLLIPAQEVFTFDKIFIKVTLSGFYHIEDPIRARHFSAYSDSELYAHAQIVLRNEITSLTLDEFLDRRREIGRIVEQAVQDSADALGLLVDSITIKDIIIPASVKRAYAGIVEAKKEAHKKLEQARGEQAILRSLANSSAMYSKNPTLLQARLIQALSTGANSIIFNHDGSLTMKPVSPLA